MGMTLAVCDSGVDFTEADVFVTVITLDVMAVIDAYSTDATIRVTYFRTYVKQLVTAFVDASMNKLFPLNRIFRQVGFNDFGVHDLEPVVDTNNQLSQLRTWEVGTEIEGNGNHRRTFRRLAKLGNG
jgi:hypothetical protein